MKCLNFITKGILVTALLTMTAQTTWADEVVTLQQDGSEWYVNMPSSGTSTLTLDDASITTFKVYDDGGKGGTGYSYSNTTGGNYSNNCNGYLVLTAPDGYLLRLSGSISSELNYDRLTVYDGSTNGDTKLLDEVGSTSVGTETAITTVVSSGPSMRIRFYSDYYRNYDGLDLTVTLVSASTEYNITVNNPVTGGNVASDKASAKANETITLTATPANGHVLSDVSVTDASGEAVALSWNVWTNSATFTMPASAVTVTPTFTSDLTSLSINMPKTGTKSATIPSGVQSFNVYDDGGSGNNYSPNCDGTLVLTAPEGYVLQLSGNISAEAGYDYLHVYDGSTTSSAKLLDKVSSSNSYGAITDITTVTSSGQSMRLYFYSSRDETIFAGLDLTVTLISTSTENNITVNNTATGGTIVSDKNTAIQGETVTLTATPADGYILNDVSVTDAIGNTIDLNWNTWTNSATFTMPAYAVSITPTFSNMTSLFVNMPKNGTKTATIPSGVTSFKVYDDGGSEKNYSDWCDGTLVLTAPEGKVLQLSGNIRADGSKDYLTVYNGIYDGTISAGTILLNEECSTEKTIAPISSTSESMTLYFYSDNKNNYAGLDLTVTLVSTGTEYGVTINNPTTGGNIAASINGSSVTNALANETITLTATPESSYLLSDVSVADESGNAIAVDVNFCNNTASFTMPASSVTIIPMFTNTLTADGGLYINMPATSYESVTIPSGVQSFKVYDDGGVTGNYSGGCNGTLVVTAPIGYVLQLSGNITTDNGFDLLTVYDGNDISTKLIDAVYSSSANTETAITTVTSSGQSMRIYFTSNDLYNYAGLDLTVTVVPITYIVSFQKNNNDATGTMDAQTHTFDAELALTANSFEYTGYAFAGWATTADGEKAYDDQQSVSNLSTTKGANVELFAKWTAIEYNITYDLAGGTVATGNPATYNVESATITLNNPSKTGYEFAGWTGTELDAASTSVTIAQGSTGNREYTATWNIITYDITYNGVEGATNPNPASYTIESEAITLDAPTKDGYTFAGWFDNAGFTGSAVTTITAGSTGDKTFWAKWIQDLTYGGVTIKDNGTTKSASLDASQESTISITSDVVVNTVELNRDFTANQPATVMLPFSLGDGQTVSGGSFYKFSGVTKDGDVWKALFTEVATLKANTPYLFMPSATGQMNFNLNGGTVTLNTTTAGEAGSTASNWEFCGTYAKVQWDGSASDPSDLSKTYGFAKGNATIAAGQFVHFAAGAWLKPMRCYLVYNGSTEGGTFQNAPSRTRGAASTEELPQTITVVLLSSSGETTGIGTLDTKTGDITLDGWYTMDGRKLEGKPTKKGLYINNGRKIVIK